MSRRLTILCSLFALAAVSATAGPLDAVLARIDLAAKTFKGMTADISSTQHTEIVDDNDVKTGTIRLLRVNAGLIRVLCEFKGNGGAYALNGNDALIYNPNTKIVDQRDIRKYKDTVNQYLLLGFGSTSAALKTSYDITYVGEEKIGAQPTSHLKLVPLSKDTLHNLKQVDLWYGENGLAAQQKLLFPAGDYRLVTYSNMKLGSMPEKDLDLKPKGAVVHKQEN